MTCKTTVCIMAAWLGLFLGLAGCDGGSGGSALVSNEKLLESEFSDPGNWTAYETYDQVAGATVAAFTAVSSTRALNRENIVTFTANGLVAEVFDYLAATSDSIAMGRLEHGISVLKFEDLDAPKGMVFNCRQVGVESLADYQERIYAWFADGSIVDAVTCETIYSDAPLGTRSIHTGTLKNRMVIQDGNIYIGTNNLEDDGSLISDRDNGLYKIDAALSQTIQLFDHPVWCLYRDSVDTIWAGTRDGIYRKDGSDFTKVHGGYAEQIFEFNSQTYALIKDFFHKPGDDTDFDLYQWDGDTFQYVCEVNAVLGNLTVEAMYAFGWEGTLYIARHGSMTDLLVFDGSSFSNVHNAIYDQFIGQHSVLVADGKLFSVGNLTGLNIWDGVDYTQLNTVNTAEGLLSNDIQVLHVDGEGSLWIGSPTSGFNILDPEDNFESYEIAGEYRIGGIFEHGGMTYVQGAVSLYEADLAGVQSYVSFSSNGERVYYDASQGRLWAFPNFGPGNGALAMLDMDTLEIWGTTGFDDRADYWQRDYEWDKPPYHFNDIVAVPDQGAVLIALENGDGKVLKYEYQENHTGTFTKVDIPVASIRYFDTTNKAVFGVGPGSLVKYAGEAWSLVNGALASEEPVGLVVKNNYGFIADCDSLEVVHLITGKTSVWGFEELPIKGTLQTVAIRTKSDPGITTKAFALYFGTDAGLVICNLNLL